MSVHLEERGGVAIATLDRPKALNALSFVILEELAGVFDQVAASNARALVVVGAGDRAFCAGADIPELRGRGLLDQRRGSALGQAVFARLDKLEIPSVAVVQGFALGGGMELALACDFRIATAGARFGLPEIKLGLIPGYGGTQRLPRLIGESRALDLVLSGRTIRAQEALDLGLVDELNTEDPSPDPTRLGVDYCERFIRYSRPALALARSAVKRACGLSLEEGLRLEADLSTLAYQTRDAEEGMAAFVEKREPVWRDE